MFLYLLMGLEAAENLAAKPLCEISKDRQHVIRSDAETSSWSGTFLTPAGERPAGCRLQPSCGSDEKKRKLPFKHLANSASLEKTNRHCRCVRVRKRGGEDKSQSALICGSLP